MQEEKQNSVVFIVRLTVHFAPQGFTYFWQEAMRLIQWVAQFLLRQHKCQVSLSVSFLIFTELWT